MRETKEVYTVERAREAEEVREKVDRLERRLGRINKELEALAQEREVVATSDLVFTWTDATTTFSWAAGYVRDRFNNIYHVPAGSRAGLSTNTYYWFGWNPVHQTMSVVTNPSQLSDIPNIIVICRVRSSATAANGTGGPGTEPNGVDLLGNKFVIA